MAGRKRLLSGVAGLLLASLILASCGKSETTGKASASTSDAAVAAVVNGEPIYVSDVNSEAELRDTIEPGAKLEVDSAEFNDILDDLIDIKLMSQEAISRGLDQDPQSRHRLATARDNILGNILIDAVVAERVDEAAIRKMYEAQIAIWELGDETHLRHILAPTKDAIDKIAAELKGGADFAVLASKRSTDEATRMEGGDLGYMKAEEATPEFAKVIKETPAGGISKPFETEMGWHIVKIDERRKEQPPSIEELRGPILAHLTRMQIGEVLKELRGEARIENRTSPRNSTLEVDPFEQPAEPADKPAPAAGANPALPPSFEAAGPKPNPEAPAPAQAAPAQPAPAAAAKPPAAQPKPPAAAPKQPAIAAAPKPQPAAPVTPPSGPVGESRPPT
jgi:peptidyl-prolyl cis-trans isomerase C